MDMDKDFLFFMVQKVSKIIERENEQDDYCQYCYRQNRFGHKPDCNFEAVQKHLDAVIEFLEDNGWNY